jgi:hypothetical protein
MVVFLNFMERIKSIFETTCSRCGTHWLKNIIVQTLKLNLHLPIYKEMDKESRTNIYPSKILEKESLNYGNNFYVYHIPLHNLLCLNKIVNIIVLVRDPRDVCVSNAFYKYSKGIIKYNEIREEMKRVLLIEGIPIPKFKDDYLEFFDKTCHRLVRFEDLKMDTFKVVKDLLNSFGYNFLDDLLLKSIEDNSFEKLTNRSVGEEDIMSHFRKGIIGDWKNYITENENQEFLSKNLDIMKLWGYV